MELWVLLNCFCCTWQYFLLKIISIPNYLYIKLLVLYLEKNTVKNKCLLWKWISLVAQRVKHLPAMWETWVQSLGQEDPLEKEMATHSTILAWRIPWMEKPGRLQSTGSHSQKWLSNFTSLENEKKKKMHTRHFSSVRFSRSVVSDSLRLHESQHANSIPVHHPCPSSLSINNSQSSLRLKSIESVMPSSHLILCRPLVLLLPIPPSIRVFSNESTLHMRWPKYWSIVPVL